ncbi:rRNA pseudouridine synthase [Thermosulfurimonas marina]|uniref:Pseudouridine synthase n=1 Tax=Thermosulfurimonas marina TaxID=2047767 RepID=A0A6H1WT40_9BACT|nr:pseudouridine synthase [Thermosulfurimonas marina]QJA06348.1 rRNA pseudouridine synthase [Thermosulfurimonas marina]
MAAKQKMRLARFLARAGVTSRRKAEDLVRSGRVKVNGQVVTDLSFRVDPERDRVEVDGQEVRLPEKVYYLFHKPRGYLTALSDPHGRPTLAEFLGGLPPGVFPVGRLDRDSEGLLLLTNDGELAQRLLHPRYAIPRVYRVWLTRPPREDLLERIRREGLEIEGRRVFPDEVRLVKRSRRECVYEVRLHEGRKREVRRIFAAAGSRVKRLVRVAFGPLKLGDLPPGKMRPLTSWELRALRRLLDSPSVPEAAGNIPRGPGGSRSPAPA